VPEALSGPNNLLIEVIQIGTTEIAHLNALEVLPDALVRIEIGLYWLLRISVLKQDRKQHSEQLYGHLLAGEMERKRA
jgi:hypothetical protein